MFSSQDEIAQFCNELSTRNVGKELKFFARTTSTNDLALEAAASGTPHGSVFVTEEQQAGRGRRGRKWESPPGFGLLFSVLLRPDSGILSGDYGWIPLIAGMAVAEAVQSVKAVRSDARRFSPSLKWPNDIVVPCDDYPGWRKLGGILCESALSSVAGSGRTGNYVVVGIGLNINHLATDLPPTEKAPATSIRVESGQAMDRKRLLRAILEALERYLVALGDEQTRVEVKTATENKLRKWWAPGVTLSIQLPGTQTVLEGEFEGLDGFGRLRIRERGGRVIESADGEIVEVRV